MELARLLDIRPGVTAVIGSGGKTTLLYALARELSEKAKVIVCTTTHIFAPTHIPCLTGISIAEIREALIKHSILCLGTPCAEGKLTAPALPMSVLQTLADYVLVEADGSRRLPLKAHAPHEPTIPPEANQTILVLGLSGLEHPISETVHRPELCTQKLCVTPETVITPELAARLLNLEGLHHRVFLNQADDEHLKNLARRLAANLNTPVCMGALERGEAECLY